MVDAVLRYAVKWNMNSKHCHAAQYVLSTVLHSYTPDELNQLTSIRSTIQGLLPYTGTFTIILNSVIYVKNLSLICEIVTEQIAISKYQ